MSDRFILSASIADERLNRPDWARDAVGACEQAGIDMLVLGRADALPFDAIVIASWAAPLVQGMGIVACVTTGLGHPFHAARSLSSIDFLSGAKSGWNPVPSHGDPAEKAKDFASAARALWDGWSADTMIIDKASGRYLDAATVHVPNYEGPFYKVRGPVNAARPPQGHPVMVVDDAAPFAIEGIDIALTSDPANAPAACKLLLKVDGAPDFASISALLGEGLIAGVHLELDNFDELLAAAKILAREFAPSRASVPDGASLRQRLGLPDAPPAIEKEKAA